MKFKKAILVLFAFSTLLFSCKKESEYKEYEGNWSGTYAADDTGSWTINIDDEGKATGTAKSDSIPFTFSGEGEISKSGAVDATVSLFGNQIRFIGQADGGSMSGTWSYVGDDFDGTWSGKKN